MRLPFLRAPVSVMALALTSGVGCVDLEPLGGNFEARVVVADIPPVIRDQLDLLFVVDNSESMAAKQQELLMSFGQLRRQLELAENGLPDLHIGVISSDLGVGLTYAVDGCSAGGDAALLQAAARLPQCNTPEAERFLRYARDPDGTEQNFTGELEDAFACIAALGTSGCRFEQPLAALGQLIERGADDSFLRDAAVLGVIFLSDEDDCSVTDDAFFDPDAFPDGPGTGKFRCFDEGVRCRGGDDVIKNNCRPEPETALMDDVFQRADQLRAVKLEDRQLVVGAITGTSASIEIREHTIDQGNEIGQTLAPACIGPVGTAFPAIRLEAFAGEFAQRAGVGALCSADGSADFDILRTTGQKLREALGHRCLVGHIRDVDDITAGRQIDCEVWAELPDGSRLPIDACATPWDIWASPGPCYAIKTGSSPCPDFPTQLALQTNWGPAGMPLGAQTKVACLVDDVDDGAEPPTTALPP